MYLGEHRDQLSSYRQINIFGFLAISFFKYLCRLCGQSLETFPCSVYSHGLEKVPTLHDSRSPVGMIEYI